MDTTILEDIGLTGSEIKVFLALIELGSSTAGKIVERSGLQNAVVHRAFHSLLEKGLMSYVKEGKRRHYQSIDPKHLLWFLDEKRQRLEKLLPELICKYNSAEKKQATIFQGKRGIKELLATILDTDAKEYSSYGGSQKAQDLLGDFFWENFHRRRIVKKIKGRILFHHKLKWWASKLNKEFPYTTARITDKTFEEITETIICGKRVAIIMYTDKPSGLLIEEENAATSYRKFFEYIWCNATLAE